MGATNDAVRAAYGDTATFQLLYPLGPFWEITAEGGILALVAGEAPSDRVTDLFGGDVRFCE